MLSKQQHHHLIKKKKLNILSIQPISKCIEYKKKSLSSPIDLPDPIKNCTSFNATANSIQIQCIPGYDGGIQQFFHVQIYDELNRQILYNTSYKYPDFTIKRLPSDSVFVIRVTSINLQGPSKTPFRLRGRTLPAPLLRTGKSIIY